MCCCYWLIKIKGSCGLVMKLAEVHFFYRSIVPSSVDVKLFQDSLDEKSVSLRESPCLTGAPTPWGADLK